MLYSKAHMAVRHAASKDPTRYNLNGIHFQADGDTVATDGHILLQAHAERPPDEEFPSVEGYEPDADPQLDSFILPLETVNALVKKLPKNPFSPVLACAALDVKRANTNGAARFYTTDLETTQTTEGKKVDGEFPNTKQVKPEGEPDATVCLNLDLLERVHKAVKEFRSSSSQKPAVKIELRGELSAVRIEFYDPNVGTLEALVMPMRL